MSSVHNTGGHYIEFLYIVAIHNTLDNINPPCTYCRICMCLQPFLGLFATFCAFGDEFYFSLKNDNIQLRYIHNTLEKVAMKWMTVWLCNLLWLVMYVPLLVELTLPYSFPCIWLHALLRFVMRQTLGEILSLAQRVPISRVGRVA